jgi:hypothetical protein
LYFSKLVKPKVFKLDSTVKVLYRYNGPEKWAQYGGIWILEHEKFSHCAAALYCQELKAKAIEMT